MIKSIFASKTQAKILDFLFQNPNQKYYQRELHKKLDESLSTIQYEIKRLIKIGILLQEKKNHRVYYFLNKNFYIYPELRDIILKTRQQQL
jgi:predicted transcriptional regulator